MASITIRNLDDSLKRRLRIRAAEHGRSMEEEAREILRITVGESAPPTDLAAAIRSRVGASGAARAARVYVDDCGETAERLDLATRRAARTEAVAPVSAPPGNSFYYCQKYIIES
jgi:plasmid stability protein